MLFALNIFALNHIAQGEGRKEGKDAKVYALFVDLKAAFDNVERGILSNTLLREDIDKNLVLMIKKIYEETIVVVKIKTRLADKFYTKKGLRQGCVMSLLLFNAYILESDKKMEKRGIRDIEIGNIKVWTMAYADDIVVLAKDRKALCDMMDTLRRFLRERKLELCVKKTKMMVFNKKGRGKKKIWKWQGEEIQEVKVFKYLGFMLNKNGNYKDHIKDEKR